MKARLTSAALRGEIRLNGQKLFGSTADFEIRFLESVLTRDPDNEEAMAGLAHIYTRKGLYQKGLALDLKLSFLNPAPITLYNLACSYALLEDSDKAFETLDEAVRLGYRDWRHLKSDSDLAALQTDPRFESLFQSLKKRP